jgi:hypothetical protein
MLEKKRKIPLKSNFFIFVLFYNWIKKDQKASVNKKKVSISLISYFKNTFLFLYDNIYLIFFNIIISIPIIAELKVKSICFLNFFQFE